MALGSWREEVLNEEQESLDTTCGNEETVGWVTHLALLQSASCDMQDRDRNATYPVSLFAANKPATPAATTANTRAEANAMLKNNVVGRSP